MCKNCGFEVTQSYCGNCGQKATVARLNVKSLAEEIAEFFTNVKANKFIYTIGCMLSQPGKTIFDYINGARKKYQSPISYFAITFLIYSLLGKYYLVPEKLYIGNVLKYDLYSLAVLLGGMSLIGWLISGWPRYNYLEVFVLFSYVYGTTFILSPFVVLIQNIPIIHKFYIYLQQHSTRAFNLFSDLPVTIYIICAIGNFFMHTQISFLRFTINFILGYIYYYMMMTYLI